MSSRELVKVATLSMCLGVVYSNSQNKKLLTSNTLSLPIKGLLFFSFFVFPLFLFTKLFFSYTSRPTPTRQQKNRKEKLKQKNGLSLLSTLLIFIYITVPFLFTRILKFTIDLKKKLWLKNNKQVFISLFRWSWNQLLTSRNLHWRERKWKVHINQKLLSNENYLLFITDEFIMTTTFKATDQYRTVCERLIQESWFHK